MDKIDYEILAAYLLFHGFDYHNDSALKNKPSRGILLDAKPEMLEALFTWFMRYLNKQISEIDKLSNDSKDDLMNIPLDEIKTREIIVGITKKALIYMFSTRDETYDELITEIKNSSINKLVETFYDNSYISYCILKEYLNYLVECFHGVIGYSKVSIIEEDNPWIVELEKNKGFDSLNDKARAVLEDMYEVAIMDDFEGGGFFRILDYYFDTSESEMVLEKYAIEFTHRTDDIKKFKRYQIRIMFADVYKSLKACSFGEYGESARKRLAILEDVEGKIFNEDYTLPEDKVIRYDFYRQFYIALKEKTMWDAQTRILEENDCVKILKPVNPLYFLD